eukprot:m.338849 g.338849  ORF g.338849 m.338849 type:complete len:119 (-) comp16087_c0_seq3:3-359(-)
MLPTAEAAPFHMNFSGDISLNVSSRLLSLLSLTSRPLTTDRFALFEWHSRTCSRTAASSPFSTLPIFRRGLLMLATCAGKERMSTYDMKSTTLLGQAFTKTLGTRWLIEGRHKAPLSS